MNWRTNLICGTIIFAFIGCSEDSAGVAGTSTEPNTLAINVPIEGQPRLCKISQSGEEDEGCDWYAEMWNPESGNRVQTGFDNGTNTSGIWYWNLDTSTYCLPSFNWPAEVGSDYDSLSFSRVIESCDGAICGTIQFECNEQTPLFEHYSNASVSFALAGKDAHGNFEPVDLSDTKGLCVGYSGFLSMQLILDSSVTGPETNFTYSVSLGFSKTDYDSLDGTYHAECFAWEDFAPYTNDMRTSFNQLNSWKDSVHIEDALKKVIGISFKNFGSDNSSYNFKIIRIGKYMNNNKNKPGDDLDYPILASDCESPEVIENFCTCNYSDSIASFVGNKKAESAYADFLDSLVETEDSTYLELSYEQLHCLMEEYFVDNHFVLKNPWLRLQPCDNPEPKIYRCSDGSMRLSKNFAPIKQTFDSIVDNVYKNTFSQKIEKYNYCANLPSSSSSSDTSSPLITDDFYQIDPTSEADLTANFIDSICPANAIPDGKWFWFTDSLYGGKTTIKWPDYLGDEWDKSSLAPVMDYCGGICGAISFDAGNIETEPFVEFGFEIAKDSAGKHIAVDASIWDGICITYSSTMTIKLELDLGDSLTNLLEFDTPKAKLPKSTDGRKKCIPWSEFEREGWGPKIEGWDDNEIIGEKTAKQLVGINILFQGRNSMEGEFNIVDISGY